MLIYNANGPSGYRIANSLRFRSSASAYLNRTPGSAGNRQTWTWSGWVKRGKLSANSYVFCARQLSTSTPYSLLYFNSTDSLVYLDDAGTSLQTTQVFRDPSSWYHIVISVNTTEATASNRYKIYINGQQVTAFSSSTYAAQNATTGVNATIPHLLGIASNGAGSYIDPFDGYLAEVNFIDGQALTPSSFGQISTVTGVWQPKAYSGTYGTNGFKLNFSNGTSTTTLGYDSSGNSNNWTTNNISLTAGSTYDWMIDSPTSYAGTSYGVGNYCVLNPLFAAGIIVNVRTQNISNGNLYASASSNSEIAGTFGVDSGKWYFETTVTYSPSNDGFGIGFYNATTKQEAIYRNESPAVFRFAGSQSSYGITFVTGDIVGCAIDIGNTSITFYVNGASQGVAKSNLPAGTWIPYLFTRASFGPTQCNANFGQRPFAFSPPAGYKSLCTYNLP